MGGIENSENQYGMSELLRLLNNVSLAAMDIKQKQGGVQILFHWMNDAFES